MKKQFNLTRLFFLLCFTTGSAPVLLKAQVIINSANLIYHQNFNTLDTTGANSSNLPAGWAIFEYGSSTSTVNGQYKGNPGTATTGEVYSYGSPGSADRALGSLATSGNRSFYGAVFKNNTGVAITGVAVAYRGEQWRRGTSATDTLQFRYSTTAFGISDTAAGKWIIHNTLSLTGIYPGSLTNTALDGNGSGNHITKSDTLHVNMQPGDSLLIAWADKDANSSDDGLAADDLSLTFITDGPPVPDHIYITGRSPSGPEVDPATNEITITFDHLIAEGNGQITLHKQGEGPVLTVAVPSMQVAVTDSTAVISGILLENNSSYSILLTEGSFRAAAQTITNTAITDTATWTFSTADTAIIRPLTSLEESFIHCTDTAMGVFKQYNKEGFKTWQCSAAGHGDNAAVSMSGGISNGISDPNTDWLISGLALDCAAMNKPELSFWHKIRFTGSVTRTLKISTDYIPGHDPATATWTTLPVQDMTEDPLEEWTPVRGIDLSPYKNMPFFLAFTYSCAEVGAYELSYDDIAVRDEALGISNQKQDQLALQVIGTATANSIHLLLTTTEAAMFTVTIFDLKGRSVYTGPLKAKAGKGQYHLTHTLLLPGLYLMRMNNSKQYKVVKVLIVP